MSDIEKPIFIIGTGRCGSTFFQRVLAYHPQLAWLSGLCNRLPQYPLLNKCLLNLVDIPALGPMLKRIFPPTETTLYWEYLAPGFSSSYRDLRADDVFKNVQQRILTEMRNHLTTKKNRQLHKLTGWPRIEYVLKIFPDALFVHLKRDGRAVASSLIEQKWWSGWKGPQRWRWGALPAQYEKEWLNGNRSFILLAAIQWKILMDAYEKSKKKVPAHSLLEIKYEDLIRTPKKTMNKVLTFCQLQKSKKFDRLLDSIHLRHSNIKWKKNLTVQQQQLIEKSLHKHLKNYGYL